MKRNQPLRGKFVVYQCTKGYSARSMFLFNIDGLTRTFMVKWFEKLKKFKLLKVLDLTDVPLKYLPKVVGGFFHLKYLCLRNKKFKKLPKFIGNLTNLQILVSYAISRRWMLLIPLCKSYQLRSVNFEICDTW